MRRLALLAIPALMLAIPALADHTDRERNWHPQFRGLDRNHDGAINRSEWRGNQTSFNRHDWNRDGFISGDELTGRARRESKDRFETSDVPSVDYDREQRFRQWDTNRDGILSSTEWRGDRQLFHLLDRNFDSRVSYTEFLDRHRNMFLTDLDRNRDRRVSRSEWRGTAAVFRDLDMDNNGYLDSEEFFYRGTRAERERRFSRLDDNRNGVIDGFEWHGDRNVFHAMDTNRNSVLDYHEFIEDPDMDTSSSADRMIEDDDVPDHDDDDTFFTWPY